MYKILAKNENLSTYQLQKWSLKIFTRADIVITVEWFAKYKQILIKVHFKDNCI